MNENHGNYIAVCNFVHLFNEQTVSLIQKLLEDKCTSNCIPCEYKDICTRNRDYKEKEK